MELELIPEMAPEAWDEAIEGFETKCLFHQSVWLDFLEKTQKAETLRFRIAENGSTLGYFAGLAVRKGPLRILGSPLPGWTTDYMGPVVGGGFDFGKFVCALDRACGLLKVHHIEVCSPHLPPEVMIAGGYEAEEYRTFVVSLFEEEEKMWGNIDKRCRQHIRKAEKNGLRVEACEGPDIVEEYYAELTEVFAKQKLVPTYPVERVRSLFDMLYPGSMTALKVMHGDKVIASGLYPYDNRCAYVFGAASWRKHQNLYPNELLLWTAMTLFAKKGVPRLDLCGDGSFKPKFGPMMMHAPKFSKSYSIAARLGRKAYRRLFSVKQAMGGRLSNLVSGTDEENGMGRAA